ncbi:hypothetical protein [Flavobacterium sp. KACC 22761]|uniref:hypothetical protein n=1 Tax=Flavobacterium sp. KACC 22761 TaxID=3092665 RepID=UPI002A76328F|nr:hypothetical protein [Flavobacterium sp. KACC 22761]WPO80747.1 hypothetical protein SCB73_10215 [Flavobacterium sp. KACC 22761]
MKIFYLSVLMMFIVSCDSNRIPKDFAVKIDYFGEHYNSKTGVYTRKYNFKQKSVKILLSEKQKSKLYSFYNEIDFLSFPTEFECDTLKGGGIIPSFWFTIEITANGIIKSSGTSSRCDYKIEMEKEKKLIIFFDEIRNMIEEDKAYKSLPESDRMSL